MCMNKCSASVAIREPTLPGDIASPRQNSYFPKIRGSHILPRFFFFWRKDDTYLCSVKCKSMQSLCKAIQRIIMKNRLGLSQQSPSGHKPETWTNCIKEVRASHALFTLAMMAVIRHIDKENNLCACTHMHTVEYYAAI